MSSWLQLCVVVWYTGDIVSEVFNPDDGPEVNTLLPEYYRNRNSEKHNMNICTLCRLFRMKFLSAYTYTTG
jgi:hypothetical protein